MSNDKKENRKHLYYLDELDDYKVKSEDPDVRGWDVKDADNRVIGKVDNLLVNKERKQVVYLDVEVDKSIIEADHDPYGKPASEEIHEFINKDGENHLIIPIGLANLNEDQEFVYTDRLNHRTFAETKRVEKGSNIDRDYEVIVMESYNRNNKADNRNDRADNDSNRTTHKDFETRPDDTYKEDYRSEETIKRMKEMDEAWRDGRRGDYDTLSRRHYETSENRTEGDNFYDRDEFEHSRFRGGRRK